MAHRGVPVTFGKIEQANEPLGITFMSLDPLSIAVYIVYAAWCLYLFYRLVRRFLRLCANTKACEQHAHVEAKENEPPPITDWTWLEALKERLKDRAG